MTPTQLLQHFDRLSEAPDAIPRLRRFILDLAVRGKLVEQDPNDEPAAELLKRILAEKVRLVKGGDIRKQGQNSSVEIEEYPFEIPKNWKWVRFGGIADFSAGRTPSRHDLSFWNTGDYSWVSIADMKDGCEIITTKETISENAKKHIFSSEPAQVGTMIMSFKLTIGKISRLGVPAFHNEAIISIYPHLPELDNYLFKVLPQFSRQGNTKDAIKGATLNRESIANIFLPIPPLAEQHRIVAKVDELMALCDQLEAAKAEREQSRDRLLAANLHNLNQPADDEESFREHVRFTFYHLPRITTRPAHIKQLRQTILNLAVRGKLVEQDPNDEPIKSISSRLDAAEENIFNVPHTWGWRNISDLSVLVTDGEHATPTRISEQQVPLVTAKNVRDGEMDYTTTDWVSYDTAEKAWRRCRPMVGDILLVCVGATTGRLCILREQKDMVLVRSVALIRPSNIINVDYLALVIRTPHGQSQIWNSVKTSAQPCLYINRINSLMFPLPPLAEQHRIVSKVDELMALCDKLETQLNTTEANSRRLLEAVLRDALSPAMVKAA